MLSKNYSCILVHDPQLPLASVHHQQLPKFSHLVSIDNRQWLMMLVTSLIAIIWLAYASNSSWRWWVSVSDYSHHCWSLKFSHLFHVLIVDDVQQIQPIPKINDGWQLWPLLPVTKFRFIVQFLEVYSWMVSSATLLVIDYQNLLTSFCC